MPPKELEQRVKFSQRNVLEHKDYKKCDKRIHEQPVSPGYQPQQHCSSQELQQYHTSRAFKSPVIVLVIGDVIC